MYYVKRPLSRFHMFTWDGHSRFFANSRRKRIDKMEQYSATPSKIGELRTGQIHAVRRYIYKERWRSEADTVESSYRHGLTAWQWVGERLSRGGFGNGRNTYSALPDLTFYLRYLRLYNISDFFTYCIVQYNEYCHQDIQYSSIVFTFKGESHKILPCTFFLLNLLI